MDQRIKYLYLAFNQPKTTKGQLTTARCVSEFFDFDDAIEFCAKFVRPGNHFYAEYMKQKINAIKDKINNNDGIVI